MLEELLPAHPDLTIRNRYGGISVIPASERGHVDYVRRVVQTGIDVNHVNDLGWTALLEAVILGDGSERYQEIVRILLAAGADRVRRVAWAAEAGHSPWRASCAAPCRPHAAAGTHLARRHARAPSWRAGPCPWPRLGHGPGRGRAALASASTSRVGRSRARAARTTSSYSGCALTTTPSSRATFTRDLEAADRDLRGLAGERVPGDGVVADPDRRRLPEDRRADLGRPLGSDERAERVRRAGPSSSGSASARRRARRPRGPR